VGARNTIQTEFCRWVNFAVSLETAMNERILALAKESGISFGGHPMNPLNVYPNQLEKFAELIVNEYISNLDFHMHDNAVMQMKWLKAKHFGIKS